MKIQNDLFHPPVLKNTTTLEPVKISTFLGSSDDWFVDKKMVSFDFFVEWDKYASLSSKLNPHVFIKSCINSDKKEWFSSFDFENNKNFTTSSQLLENLVVFKQINELFKSTVFKSPALMLFNEDEFSENMKIVRVMENEGSFVGKNWSLFDLKNDVMTMSNSSQSKAGATVGAKGLTLATTQLEKGLSTTSAAWAGDCDALFFDEKNEPSFIVEFQKFNKDEPEVFKNEYNLDFLLNNTKANQKKKIKRLLILAKNITNRDIPLMILYYPTSPNIKEFKVQVIDYDKNAVGIKAVESIHAIKTVNIPFEDTPEQSLESVYKVMSSLRNECGLINKTARVCEAEQTTGRSSSDSEMFYAQLKERKNDKSFAAEALKNKCDIYESLSSMLKEDCDLLKLALEIDGNNIRHSSLKFRKESIRANIYAVEQTPMALKVVDSKYRDSEEVVSAAVMRAPESLVFASSRLRSDKKFILGLLNQRVNCLEYVSKEIIEKLNGQSDKEAYFRSWCEKEDLSELTGACEPIVEKKGFHR